MKILFCPAHYAHLHDRGSEIEWAYQITRSLATKYKGSLVVTGFSNVSDASYKIEKLQIDQRKIDLGFKNTLKFLLLYGFFAMRKLKQESFDIHHHVLPFYIGRTFNIAMILSKNDRVVRVIGPIQNPLPYFSDNLHDQHEELSTIKRISNTAFMVLLHFMGMFFYWLSYRTMDRADAVVVINKAAKLDLIKAGVDRKKIYTIPPGVSISNFAADRSGTISKKKTIEIISVGALIHRKGFDLLILGINEVIKANSKIDFLVNIIGEGPQKAKLEQLVKSLGLSEVVKFKGYVHHKEMPKEYQKADIFISMTRADSFPQMYLEAMASGLAMITTKNFGSVALIKNAQTGYLIKNGDYKYMARKLLFLLENKTTLQTFQISSLRESKKYDWETSIIPKYLVLYNKLLDEKATTFRLVRDKQ